MRIFKIHPLLKMANFKHILKRTIITFLIGYMIKYLIVSVWAINVLIDFSHPIALLYFFFLSIVYSIIYMYDLDFYFPVGNIETGENKISNIKNSKSYIMNKAPNVSDSESDAGISITSQDLDPVSPNGQSPNPAQENNPNPNSPSRESPNPPVPPMLPPSSPSSVPSLPSMEWPEENDFIVTEETALTPDRDDPIRVEYYSKHLKELKDDTKHMKFELDAKNESSKLIYEVKDGEKSADNLTEKEQGVLDDAEHDIGSDIDETISRVREDTKDYRDALELRVKNLEYMTKKVTEKNIPIPDDIKEGLEELVDSAKESVKTTDNMEQSRNSNQNVNTTDNLEQSNDSNQNVYTTDNLEQNSDSNQNVDTTDNLEQSHDSNENSKLNQEQNKDNNITKRSYIDIEDDKSNLEQNSDSNPAKRRRT